jgi:hypothetical protein
MYFPDTGMIFLSDQYSKDFGALSKSMDFEKSIKWNSTGTSKGIIDHEIGHAISKKLGIGKIPEVQQIFDDVSKKKGGIKNALSEYGATSSEEFIAEAWAEYRNSKKPRPLAKKIGRIMEDEYSKQYKKT